MPSHQNEDLPSIEDFLNKSNQLLSLSEYLIKENDDLPSISKFISEEVNVTDEESVEEEILEENENNLIEILRLINNVKDSIPSIPEIKYYDEELSLIENKLEILKNYVVNLPQVKYYDNEILDLEDKINQVNESIPVFPRWINEVNEVPDFSWIGKTFSVIDDDIIKVNDNIQNLKNNFESQVDSLIETIDLKNFEVNVDIKSISENLKETKDKIYLELRESALKIWKLSRDLKEDKTSLKKEIENQYHILQSSIDECVSDLDEKISTDISDLKNYFNNLSEEIKKLPKVKYYDSEVESLRKEIKENSLDIQELKNIAHLIKEQQIKLKEELNEGLLNIPPSTENSDPLTPLNQNFATLDDLANHYKIFINRIQTQLSAIGGGGAGYVKDLSDVDVTGITTDSFLKWNPSNNKWVIGSLSGIGRTTLVTLNDIDSSNLGDGRFLRYDASSNQFTFSPVSASNLELISGDIQSGLLTTYTTNESVIISVSSSIYRSVNYQIQVTDDSNFNMTTINVIHDGSNTYMTEYGTINQPIGIATFSSDINSGSLRLLGYPASSNKTTFKVIYTAIET